MGETLTLMVGVAVIPTLFFNPVVFLQLVDILELIRYLQFIDIEYPKLVEDYFDLFKNFDFEFLPNLIPSNLNQMDSPKRF